MLLPAECGCSSCAADSQPPKEVVTAGPELEEARVGKEASDASQPDVLTPVSPRSLLRMITDDSVVDVSTKSERLETLTNPKIEQGMIRAITLRKSIRQMGRLWRRPLLPMPEERLTDLYEWSRPAEEYDYFLSHTWETWGGLKYISLLKLGHACLSMLVPALEIATGPKPLMHRKQHLQSQECTPAIAFFSAAGCRPWCFAGASA